MLTQHESLITIHKPLFFLPYFVFCPRSQSSACPRSCQTVSFTARASDSTASSTPASTPRSTRWPLSQSTKPANTSERPVSPVALFLSLQFQMCWLVIDAVDRWRFFIDVFPGTSTAVIYLFQWNAETFQGEVINACNDNLTMYQGLHCICQL